MPSKGPKVRPFAACRHCKRMKDIYGRGLCTTCYYDPAVRPRYPLLTGDAPWESKCKACRECGVKKGVAEGGLCRKCYETPEVYERWVVGDGVADDGREPTEEELEAVIAEQMANLPDWWDEEARLERQGLGDEPGGGWTPPVRRAMYRRGREVVYRIG